MTHTIFKMNPDKKAAKAAYKAARKTNVKLRSERRMWLTEKYIGKYKGGNNALCNSVPLPVTIGGIKYPSGTVALMCETKRRMKADRKCSHENIIVQTTAETTAETKSETTSETTTETKDETTAAETKMYDLIEEQIQHEICHYKYETYDTVRQALQFAQGKTLVFWPTEPKWCQKFDIMPSSRWEAVVPKQSYFKQISDQYEDEEIVGENLLATIWNKLYRHAFV